MDLTGFIEKIDRFPKNLDAVEMKRQIAELDIELHKLTSKIPIHHSELQWIKVKLGFIGEFNFPLLKQGKTSTIDVFCAPDLFSLILELILDYILLWQGSAVTIVIHLNPIIKRIHLENYF
jgi:hypothetical protein